jgi:hypothetical protein
MPRLVECRRRLALASLLHDEVNGTNGLFAIDLLPVVIKEADISVLGQDLRHLLVVTRIGGTLGGVQITRVL